MIFAYPVNQMKRMSTRAFTVVKWLLGDGSLVYLIIPTDNVHMSLYGTAQFKLYTRVYLHACVCTFNACKTSKIGVQSTIARGFVVRTSVIKHSWHTRYTPHEQTRYERTPAQITI